MNDSDINLILAIADGRLTGQAKQDALEHIATDPELGSELATQMAAVEDLQSIPPARMTADERSTLHANLIEQLHLDPAPVATVAAKRTRQAWWQPVVGLASAAALLVAIVVIPGMFGGSDDSAEEVAAFTRETVASDESAVSDDSADGGDTATSVPTAPVVVTDSVVAIPEIPEDEVLEFFASSDPTTQEDATPTGSTTDAGESGVDAESQSLKSPPAPIDEESLNECLDDLGDQLPDDDLIPRAVTTTADGQIVHLGADTDVGVDYVVSIDLSTCTITSIDR